MSLAAQHNDVTKLKAHKRKPGYRNRKINNAVCHIPAKLLVENFTVPHVKGVEESVLSDLRFQRPPEAKRLKALYKKLTTRGIDFLLSITANIRTTGAYDEITDTSFNYMPSAHGDFYIVDGSHRVNSLEMLYNAIYNNTDPSLDKSEIELLKKEFENLELIVVVMFTSFTNEVYVFNEINSNSKPVKGDNIIANVVNSVDHTDLELIEDLKSADSDLKYTFDDVNAFRIAKDLYNDSTSVWYRRIKFSGGKALTPNVGIASITKYFSKVIDSALSGPKATADEKRIWCEDNINAYWGALSMVYKSGFKDNAPKYSFQKALGTDVFMRIWPKMNETIIAGSTSKIDWADPNIYIPGFKKIKENLSGVRGDGSNEEKIRGHEFWLSGKQGAVGNYQGEKGKKILARKLEVALTQ